MPAVETQRLPVPGADHQLVVRHSVEVRRPLARIMPAPPLHLLGRGVEDVQDVGRLAIADLDAKRVHENEPLDPVAALHRNFRREPTAEGQPHKCHPLVRQRLENVEIEVDQVIDRVKIRRAHRVAKARVRGGNDLRPPAE
jgi:hypothetical protein